MLHRRRMASFVTVGLPAAGLALAAAGIGWGATPLRDGLAGAVPAPGPGTAAAPGVAARQDPLLAQRTKGDAAAPITVYEVTDFACPWCRYFWQHALPAIDSEYIQTGKVRFIFVNLPIPQLHPNAAAAHEFAMCAARQNAFWPIHDLLYGHQEEWAGLEEPRVYFNALADSAGLDHGSLDECVDTGALRWLVEQEVQAVTERAGITGTPSFIIENIVLNGFFPIEEWRPILDSVYVAKTTGGRRPEGR